MKNFQLLPNEHIIKHETSVLYGHGALSGFDDELALTNLHIIHVEKGLFGKVKQVRKMPLNHVRISMGKAQVRCEKSQENGRHELQVFMKDGGIETFQFRRGKKEANLWVNEITMAIEGIRGIPNKSPGKQEPTFVEELKGMAISAIKGALSIDTPQPSSPNARPTAQPKKTTNQCIGCGAPLTGILGEVVKCEYCDIEQTLK